jgi:basic membrane lipoprotein Med (substrate-binding protein (PBP1-ABC) superfamily)
MKTKTFTLAICALLASTVVAKAQSQQPDMAAPSGAAVSGGASATPRAAAGTSVENTVPVGASDRPRSTGGASRTRRSAAPAKAVVMSFEATCYEEVRAYFMSKGLAATPEIYGTHFPDPKKQYVAHTSRMSNLGGLPESKCANGTLPVMLPPNNNAYNLARGIKEGNAVCAIMNQWRIYADRVVSRLADDAPTVNIVVDGETKTFKRWGVVVGDVNQQDVGYALCESPLESAATEQKLEDRVNKFEEKMNKELGKDRERIGKLEKKADAQPGIDGAQNVAIVDLQTRVTKLENEKRRTWMYVGLNLQDSVTQAANFMSGIRAGIMFERFNGHLLGEVGAHGMFMQEQYLLEQNGLPTTSLGGGLHIALAYKWDNGLFLGGEVTGTYMQSVSFVEGQTSQGTTLGVLGAGPVIGVAKGKFFAQLSLPLVCDWQMVQALTNNDQVAFPVAPNKLPGLAPTLAAGFRF